MSGCERAVETLCHVANTIDLTEVERAAVKASITRMTGRLHVERGKRCLDHGDVSGAADAIARANQVEWRLKRWFIQLAIRFWPSLLLRIDRVRRRVSSSPHRRPSTPGRAAVVLRDH